MNFKTLNEWLNYLESLPPKTSRLPLEQLKAIAQELMIWPIPCPVITVTGTNGKGSCVALLTACLTATGNRVGTYTSPHLLTYNERICCNNKQVSDAELCDAFTAIEQVRNNVPLNYFEFTTLAALYLFKQTALDVWILEVGIGGRLDPVNIIDADVAIISTVAIDHIAWLGTTRELIGREKAGIIRAHKAVICGDFETPNSIIEYAKELTAPLYQQGKEFGFIRQCSSWTWWSKSLGEFTQLPLPQVEMQNAATVLAALACLPQSLFKQAGKAFTKETLYQAIQQTHLPGRFQKISGAVIQILDVAHNPAAAELLAHHLQNEYCTGRRLAVVAMLADKDLLGTVTPLLPLINIWHVGGIQKARGSNADHLAQILSLHGASFVYTYASVSSAYTATLADACTGDLIVVFGSFYTVSEVLQTL